MKVIAYVRIIPKADESKVNFLKRIERKWQERWRKARIFEADPDQRPKFMVTFPYPYINAFPHLGSAYTVLRVDIIARYKRMRGFNVLFAQGFHATGGPIMAAALRVREGDPKEISILKIMGIEDKEIPKFRDPEYWVKYFCREWIKDFKRYGLSIDWRREFYTTYLNPPYNKFVQWQYNKLKEKGLIVKGEHPVVWCPKENKVVGDHDRPDEYIGISPEEATILKFKDDEGFIYPCLTYRPETVYGAVNIWVNPDAEYLIAKVDGENWFICRYGASELCDQDHKVEIKGKIKGADLVGKIVLNPVTKSRILVLPASFVEPELGTGIVMSVPAHAPYDYVALEELKKHPEILKKYDLKPEIIKKIKPVGIIELKGYGEEPAAKIVKSMRIKSQKEKEKLDRATREIYSKEFYQGTLKKVFGKWSGKIVCEVKDEIISDFVSKGIAVKCYTLPSVVYCRCGAKAHVKIVKDQWFLRYSDPEWKRKAHECIDRMKFFPEDVRDYFHSQVDWYGDWACAHQGELGSPLPWDKNWVLESLSDSTIYMAYYTLAKYLQHKEKYGIDWNKISDEFYDYVLLGIGNPKKVAKKTGIDERLLQEMRKEFLYWYPVDLRISGKDLMPNHLIFFIMHHVAIFPKKFWPRGIGINGWIRVAGRKMSKSLGNFIILRQALEWWGCDATRFAEAYAGDAGLEDANFEPEIADRAVELLYNWYNFATTNYGRGRDNWLSIDKWFETMLYKTIEEVTLEMEKTNFKTALIKGFFDLQNAFKWYKRRCGDEPNRSLLNKFIEIQTLILAPFTPHIAEEIWEKLGKKEFISLARWPIVDKSKIDVSAEKAEKIVKLILEDSKEIIKLLKSKPKQLKIILASRWKYYLFKEISSEIKRGRNMRDAIRNSISRMKIDKKLLKIIIPRIIRDPKPLNLFITPELEEKAIIEAKEFLERELNVKINVIREDESSENKARYALPAKPALVAR